MADKNQLCKWQGNRVLLVEGVNDCHVIMALCQFYDVLQNFGIYECESDYGVLKRLNALIIMPDPPEVIGIVLDADKPDVEGRWQSIKSKLKNYHYDFPSTPAIEGSIIFSKEETPRLGIWLMPNNQATGMLEDFCTQMISEEAKSVARRCVQIAQEEKVSTFKDVHHSKAVIHTYLAWQDTPGAPLGQAITRHALRPDSEIAASFVQWLIKLFKA